MSKKQLKVERFNLRLSKNELLALRYKASVEGVSVSKYVLSRATE